MHSSTGPSTYFEKFERDNDFLTTALASRCAIGLTILILLATGLELRRRTWTETAQIRFRHDIDNALYWGGRVLDEGERLTGKKPASQTIAEGMGEAPGPIAVVAAG